MQIPRLHLFELEDQAWFPPVVRDLATDYLHFMESKFSLHRPVVPLLAEALRSTRATRIIDLCSGGGGPIPRLLADLASMGLHPRVVLTDRFPNTGAFAAIAAQFPDAILFHDQAIDARRVPREFQGFRTLYNSFHHFPPPDAQKILQDAVEARQPIGVFEIPDRTWGTLLPLFFLTPWLVALATPFIRPFRWRRLLWTYLVPLVPLVCWCDGIVSQLRAYKVNELEAMTQRLEPNDYYWKAGRVPIGSTPGYLTYLIGYETR